MQQPLRVSITLRVLSISITSSSCGPACQVNLFLAVLKVKFAKAQTIFMAKQAASRKVWE